MKSHTFLACLFMIGKLFAGPLLDLTGSKIWSIKPFESGRKYWCIIRDQEKMEKGMVYHIEVVYRDLGSQVYNVIKIIPHMAITEVALKSSVIKKLKRGDVYPEQYEEARKQWEMDRANGDLNICRSSIYECFEMAEKGD